MNKNNNRRVKGSVLFTVVSVMSLLIIFLMGTLVLATSANKRAYKSYSSSQTQYTARAAVDSILAAVGDSSADGRALASAIRSLDNVTDAPINVTVNMGGNGIGRVTDAKIALIDKEYPIYDSVDQEWVKCKRYSITAEVELGNETTTVTSYVLCDAPTGSGGGGGGGFTTSGGVAGAGNHTSAVGGTYIALGNAATKQYIGTNPVTGAGFTLEDKLYLSDNGRGFDAAGNPVTPYTFGNYYLTEAPFVIDGSMQMNSKATFLIPKAGNGVAIWGDLKFGNYAPEIVSVNMDNSDSDLTTPGVQSYSFNTMPYLYVDGKISTDSNLHLGSGDLPLNIFCGYIEPGQFNSCDIKADVFCYDADKTTVLGANGGGGHLYRWSSSVVNKGVTYDYVGGNFYSKGNLKINTGTTMEFGGAAVGQSVNVNVEGNVDIQGNTKIYGNLVVGGNLNISNGATLDVTGSIYANTITGSGVTVGSKTLKPNVQSNIYDAVAAKNVKIYGNEGWSPTRPYAWLKQDALADSSFTINDETVNVNGTDYVFKNFNEGMVQDPSTGKDYVIETFDNPPDMTTPKTYEVLTDITTGEILTEAQAYDMGEMSYNGKTVDPISDYIATGSTIFPDYAEKDVILGLTQLSGIPVEDTKVLDTVKAISEKQLSPAEFETAIPGNVDVSTVVSCSSLADGAEITDSCTLTGSTFKQTIYITPPENGELWIKLKDVTINDTSKIIVRDVKKSYNAVGQVDSVQKLNGKVNFFVEGTLNFAASNNALVTESYDQILSNTNIDIWTGTDVNLSTAAAGVNAYSDADIIDITNTALWNSPSSVKAVNAPAPNIYIYSSNEFNNAEMTDPKNKVMIENLPRITAYIKAPYLQFSGVDFGNVGNKIYYNNADAKSYAGVGNRCVIGCVVCYEAALTNDWMNVYIPENNTVAPPIIAGGGLGTHTYQAVDYLMY